MALVRTQLHLWFLRGCTERPEQWVSFSRFILSLCPQDLERESHNPRTLDVRYWFGGSRATKRFWQLLVPRSWVRRNPFLVRSQLRTMRMMGYSRNHLSRRLVDVSVKENLGGQTVQEAGPWALAPL